MSGPTRKVLGRLRGSSQPSGSGSGRRKRQRGTPPDAIGRGPLVSAPGLLLGIVVPVRNEAPYLEEWLAYHHALGVDHFFIYDNGSDDDLHGVVDRWVNHGLVTVVHWPLPGGQIDAYSHALRFFGATFEWLAFVDVDEFIVPLVDDDLPSLLARWPNAADVRIPRVDFGYSGHREPPSTLTIEAYTGVADVFARDPAKPQRVKSVVRPSGVSAMGIHTATLADAAAVAGTDAPTESIGRRSGEFAQVNHYYTRSFDEFEAKRVRGSATGRQARPAVPFDLPTLRTDASAQRFAERTEAMLSRMRSLEPSPYHYGSELGLEQFPHYNDLGLFAEFAVVNTALGEPALRREPAQRMQNVFDGIGFIGDVGAVGYEPTRAGLSDSMHLGPLLDRARARVEASWADGPAGSPSIEGRALKVDGEAWQLPADDDGAEARFIIDDTAARRCYAVGFVVRASGGATVAVSLDGPDGTAPIRPRDVRLSGGTTHAGIIEIAAEPRLVDRVSVRFAGDRAGLSIYDLFVISYG